MTPQPFPHCPADCPGPPAWAGGTRPPRSPRSPTQPGCVGDRAWLPRFQNASRSSNSLWGQGMLPKMYNLGPGGERLQCHLPGWKVLGGDRTYWTWFLGGGMCCGSSNLGGGLGLPWWEWGKCCGTKGHPSCSGVGGSLRMQRCGDLARGHTWTRLSCSPGCARPPNSLFLPFYLKNP